MQDDTQIVIGAVYLAAAVLFVLGLRRLGSPATGRSGNLLASAGMLIAVAATLFNQDILSYELIAAGILIGAVLGAGMARTIRMTDMPQMVAVFNGLGGGASAIVAAAEFHRLSSAPEAVPLDATVIIVIGTLIGTATFSGSLVAFGKLQGLVSGRPIIFPAQKLVSLAIFLGALGLMAYVAVTPQTPIFIALAVVSLALGILLVVPIGGADMPVVISLLNSYSGLAAASAGFVLDNGILIVAGALVGAAGLILTQIMTKAMNRSLLNVMFGAFGEAGPGVHAVDGRAGPRPVREVTPEDAAIILGYAKLAIFVPGYGLAVAQAQHQLKELAGLMKSRGVEVKYGIHPVAGRMPGHMNVLLAEADVSYDDLYDLESINDQFDEADVALVVGANDVVNPAARDAPDSPIYGMPILNVDQAGHTIVLKRSLSPGFAGIDNELFYEAKTSMLFGDAKQSLARLIDEVRDL